MKFQEKIKRTEKAMLANIVIVLMCIVIIIFLNNIRHELTLIENYIFIPKLCLLFIIGLNLISAIALHIQKNRFIKEHKDLSIEKEFIKDNKLI